MDRNLREQERAFAQRLDQLSRKLETLRSRSFVGATRTIYQAGNLPPNGDRLPLFTEEVSSGKWLVTANATGTATSVAATPTGIWHISSSIWTTAGELYADTDSIFPHAQGTPYWSLTAGTKYARLTLNGVGWLDVPDRFQVSLDVWTENASDPVWWLECKLVLTPL